MNMKAEDYFRNAAIAFTSIPAIFTLYNVIEKHWDFDKHSKIVNLLITSVLKKSDIKTAKLVVGIYFALTGIGYTACGIYACMETRKKYMYNKPVMHVSDLEDEEEPIIEMYCCE